MYLTRRNRPMMMVVAVSSITYLRGIFPEDAYRSRYLEGEHSEKLARSLIKSVFGEKMYTYWMLMGCFDALEKQYVSRRIIESYHFKFRYSAKGPEMDILRNNGIKMQVTMDDTKKALVLLIRKLFLLMQNLDVLPSNVYLTMKLYYYDEITPADYQPPGFKEGECDSLWFEGVAVNFRVGEVETPFHTLKIAVSAEQDRVEKLQKGNHLGETKQVSQGAFPEKEIEKVVHIIDAALHNSPTFACVPLGKTDRLPWMCCCCLNPHPKTKQNIKLNKRLTLLTFL
uniref:Zebrafish testis-expressed 38 n=1 Tax=Astatotilapia calliptera TaxID=8154 RepID=A0A3P8PP11_ASTCA